MVKQVKYYLMIQPEKAPHYLGHNPMQQFSYTGMYAVAALMVITGFTLYGQSNPGGFFYSLTNWFVPLAGGLQIVRFVHHIASWAFLIFVPIHVYLATRADVMERTGTISSIFSGGRFVRSDVTYVDE
jgi:Ni/Fe-hydrogenase b-type cytochrome subunit